MVGKQENQVEEDERIVVPEASEPSSTLATKPEADSGGTFSAGLEIELPPKGADLPQLFEGRDESTGNQMKVDVLTDKLIEKREKLEYFIIIAATTVIVFTLRDLNDPRGFLFLANIWFPVSGWAALLASSGCALFALRRRHTLISINQEWRYTGRNRAKDEREAKRIKRNTSLVKVSDFLMGLLFVSGMALLATAYSVALYKAR